MKVKQGEKYLQKRGLACPFCGSWDIEGGSMDFEAPGEIDQRISCHVCNGQWTDVYKLAAVADWDSGTIIASISIQAE
jgi:transposase-like protein